VTWGRRDTHGHTTSVLWRDFKGWVLKNRLDLVIFNEQWDWVPVVRARRELGVTIGAYVDYYTADTVRFFDLYDFLLCNTRRHHRVFRSHRKALHIPWGTDTALFKDECRPVAADSVAFLHSAGMNPGRKGTLAALQAFTGLPGNCRFILHMQDGLDRFPEIAEVCRSDKRIEIINKTIPAPGPYHLGDVYVYPTTLDGIGLTICEALACGLPVITTDAPPMNEFVRHGANGYLVQPHEHRARSDGYYWATSHCRPEDVRAGMLYYLNNLGRLAELKSSARQSATEQFDWRRNAAGLAETLAGLGRASLPRADLSALEWDAVLYSARFFTWRRRLLQRMCLRPGSAGLAAVLRFLCG
jgi:1,2-diacylglycerol 3-alpha-glucosyltransferase